MSAGWRSRVQLPQESLVRFCRRNRIRRLAVFGSVLRDDFGPESDVGILVEFHPDEPMDFIRLGTLEAEMSDMIDRRVDLNTPGSLDPRFRDVVLQEAEAIHVAA